MIRTIAYKILVHKRYIIAWANDEIKAVKKFIYNTKFLKIVEIFSIIPKPKIDNFKISQIEERWLQNQIAIKIQRASLNSCKKISISIFSFNRKPRLKNF